MAASNKALPLLNPKCYSTPKFYCYEFQNHLLQFAYQGKLSVFFNCKHLFEPPLIIIDDTSKVKLQYELESMCYEGVDDDETSGSEDSKSYDNLDGVSFICFYNFFL